MELNSPPDVVNPLRVSVQPNGKKRLILDLRYINNFLIKRRVKYEDWKIALSYFQNVLNRLRSIGGSMVLILLYFLMMAG